LRIFKIQSENQSEHSASNDKSPSKTPFQNQSRKISKKIPTARTSTAFPKQNSLSPKPPK